MTTYDYKRRALELVDDYLAGKAARESVWRWAQEIIVSKEWERISPDIQDAIHGLWLLHDTEGSWIPSMEELKRIRDNLAR